MTDYKISLTLYDIKIDAHLNTLVRSSDPYLRKMLEEEIRGRTAGPGKSFQFSVPENDFRTCVSTYGEQHVSNPSADLDQYFDIVNRRFYSRNIPTQLAVLYLFGNGKQYRASVTAGNEHRRRRPCTQYCMEKFGYRPLVRPLGVMPDAVLWTRRNGRLSLALAEAKASTASDPKQFAKQTCISVFVDVKTRATGFTYDYEGYLICCSFQDGRHVECVTLRVDLAYFNAGRNPPTSTDPSPGFDPTIPTYENPDARLRAIIRVQAETCAAQDEYLTTILSEEASRSATLALIKQGNPLDESIQVDAYVNQVARELGLEDKWKLGQMLIKDTKKAEEEKLTTAIQRFKKPDTNLD